MEKYDLLMCICDNHYLFDYQSKFQFIEILKKNVKVLRKELMNCINITQHLIIVKLDDLFIVVHKMCH